MKIKNNVLVKVEESDIINGTVVIPQGVTDIGKYVLYNYSNVTSITIPASVTSIGNYAFAGDWDTTMNLKSVTIEEGSKLEIIGRYAFWGCINLISITIPASVREIGLEAFESCDKLKTVNKAYKAFSLILGKFICRKKTYSEYKTNYVRGELSMCENGIHYCTNLFEIFNYYNGTIDEDIAIFEIKPGSKIITNYCDSKCCTNSIRLMRRLYCDDIIRILNGNE